MNTNMNTNINLNINMSHFTKFLIGIKKKDENDLKKNIKFNKTYFPDEISRSCVQLRYALEDSINNMIKNNKCETSIIRFDQNINVNFKDCGLDKEIIKLNDIIKEKTGFRLKVVHNLTYDSNEISVSIGSSYTDYN